MRSAIALGFAVDEEILGEAPDRVARVAVGPPLEVLQEIPPPGRVAVVDILTGQRAGELLTGAVTRASDRAAAVALGVLARAGGVETRHARKAAWNEVVGHVTRPPIRR